MPSRSIRRRPVNVADLGERPREVFRHLVDAFLTSGEPVGSRTLSQRLPVSLSPASIRNVMADLEHMGLLYAPHTSAGRVPTERGLRLFVDGLLEIGELDQDERRAIEARITGQGRGIEDVLTQATMLLSGLSRCAGLVVAPKQETTLKHVEFVTVAPGKALVVMVSDDGQVENRLIDTPLGLPVSALSEAANYLNARLRGRTLEGARAEILFELEGERAELDALTAKIVAEGLATLAEPAGAGKKEAEEKVLIVRGASHLLDSVDAQADIERVRTLFDDIERKNDLIRLLGIGARRHGRAHLHRLGEPAVQPVGLLGGGGPLCQCRGQGGGRDRHCRTHASQLCPHHSDGGPHRQGRGPPAGLNFKESHMNPEDEDMMPEVQGAPEAEGELAALKAEMAELKDRLLRALADTENTRRRG